MRNDYLIIHLSNPASAAPVLIKPQLVADCGDIIENFARHVVGALNKSASPTVRLAAVDRGSIQLAFLVDFISDASALVTKENIGVAADVVQIGAAFLSVFWFSLKKWGGGHSVEDLNIERQPFGIEAMQIGSDVNGGGILQRLASVLVSSGVEQVKVSIPGFPDIILVGEHSYFASLIGSEVRQPGKRGPYSGKLRKLQGPIRLKQRQDGQVVEFHWGNTLSRERPTLVLVRWKSKRSVEDAMAQPEVQVEGGLEPLDMDGWISLDKIPPVLKRATGLLIVNRQFIGE